jgi:Nif-specific regulatory protein
MKNFNSRSELSGDCMRCEVQFKEILDLLDSLNRTIQNDEDISLILRDSLSVLSRRKEFLRGSVTIFDRKSGRIFTKESFGFSSEEQNRGIYILGEGITGEVVETGSPIMVERISEDARFLNRTGARRNVREDDAAYLCVPVKSNREVIGTLSIDRCLGDPEETRRDLKVLEIVASMISQAVRLYRSHYEERQELISENLRLIEALGASIRPRHIIGETANMRGLYAMVRRVAKTSATVLILGESGVGKELVARAVHEESERREKPFVSLNCAALPESVIESELFGHERGAFTGAVAERKGRFELAEGGTIFLDEIGELSMNMQAKLLRVLQEREFERVGGVHTLRADVRVLAATNRDLESEVRQMRFREDLYYRLNIIPITVPPLRDRKSDILPLVNHFIEKCNHRNGLSITRISTPAIDMLMAYHWPGNVRELENCIERAAILSEDGVIHGYHLPPTLQMAAPAEQGYTEAASLQQRLDSFEYELLVEALKATRGNLSRSAELLGLTNRQIGIRMRKYRLDYRDYRIL